VRERERSPARIVGHRGEVVETEHAVSVAVARPDGAVVAWAGDPRRVTPIRSTAKPFQALALFVSGAAERFAVSSEELALACASHQGTPRHTALAAGLLGRLGLDEGALGCGGHPPLDEASALAAARVGPYRRPLSNNCSGKHAAMLATAAALGAPAAGYLALDHPVQRAIRALHEELAGTPHLDAVIDGCSAPCWVMGLHRLARMYAHLVAPEAAPPPLRDGLRALYAAMRAHPELVAGDGVPDTTLMRVVPGLVAKRGADGCYAMGLTGGPDGPVGIALKVHDGHGEARTAAVVAVLDALGIPAEAAAGLAPLRNPRRLNWRGSVVGSYEAEIALIR